MISQIGTAPGPLQTGPPRGAVSNSTETNGASSPFGDLVQQIIGEGGAAKAAPLTGAKAVARLQSAPVSEQAAVVSNNVAAPVVNVPAPPSVDPFSETQVVADPKKVNVKTAATQDAVQLSEASALAVPEKMLETPAAAAVLSGPARVARKPETVKSAAPAPLIAVATADFGLQRPLKIPVGEKDAGSAQVPAAQAAEEAPATVGAPAAVQVKIRAQDEAATPALQPVATAAKVVPVPVLPSELPVSAVPAAAVSPVPAVAIPVVTPPQAIPQTATAKAAPLPGPGAQMDEPISEQPKTQPLKSVSIEFTPDGAQDVRLRLSEHAGDVHISLHTTDPSLSGRLNDGVKDLVDSLTTAGYDAQAWTPDQGRQNQRQGEEPRRTRNQGSGDPGAETFDGVMQQPSIEEIS